MKQAQFISRSYGNMEVTLCYNQKEGLSNDLFKCDYLKNRRGADPLMFYMRDYFKDRLERELEHKFIAHVHSGGAIQLMRTRGILSYKQADSIEVHAYGPGQLVSKSYFQDAHNYVSKLDIVSYLASPCAHLVAICGGSYDVKYLEPSSKNFLKEHSFLGETYSKEVIDLGKDFVKIYGGELRDE